MATWKAVITNKTDVDSAGLISVFFDVWRDEEVAYPNQSVICSPATYTTSVSEVVRNFKSQNESADAIVIGEEIPA